MTQGILPFKYYEEKKCSGMTALAGLPPYLDLAFVSGLNHSIETHLHIRDGVQGSKLRRHPFILTIDMRRRP